jgi:hypothetical protein
VQLHFPNIIKSLLNLGIESPKYEIDSRGTWKSAGDVVLGGTQEGEDGYDIIEWIAQQP